MYQNEKDMKMIDLIVSYESSLWNVDGPSCLLFKIDIVLFWYLHIMWPYGEG